MSLIPHQIKSTPLLNVPRPSKQNREPKEFYFTPHVRSRIFLSLNPDQTSEPLDVVGRILCNKHPVYTPSMWGAYYEEWVNGNRQPPGYFHRGKWAPQLSANLEESLLRSGEEEISRCDYTDDVATYLRGKYGLFSVDRWMDMLDARRQFHSLLFDRSDVVVDTSSMRLEDGAEGEHDDIAVDFDTLDLGEPAKVRPSWSSYWPAVHGHTPSTYITGETPGATRGARCALEPFGSDPDNAMAEQEDGFIQPSRRRKRQVN